MEEFDEMNYRIEHEELADLGYYFLEYGQEEQCLEKINDELAQRVGMEVLKHLSSKMIKDLSSLDLEEINKYLVENVSGIDEMVSGVRDKYLLEIKNKRKSILIEENSQRWKCFVD